MKTPDSNDTNVMSKTPDEIKKWMKCCSINPPKCNECPANIENSLCDISMLRSTLAYIQQLERERDAVIEDIKVAATFLCQTCKKYHPAVIDGTKHFCDEIPADHFDDGAIACGMYEWRGVKEEKDDNTRRYQEGA